MSNDPKDVYLGEAIFRTLSLKKKKYVQQALIARDPDKWKIFKRRADVIFHFSIENNDPKRIDIYGLELRQYDDDDIIDDIINFK